MYTQVTEFRTRPRTPSPHAPTEAYTRTRTRTHVYVCSFLSKWLKFTSRLLLARGKCAKYGLCVCVCAPSKSNVRLVHPVAVFIQYICRCTGGGSGVGGTHYLYARVLLSSNRQSGGKVAKLVRAYLSSCLSLPHLSCAHNLSAYIIFFIYIRPGVCMCVNVCARVNW